jgi:cell wall-associated NlpC family hydrolase
MSEIFAVMKYLGIPYKHMGRTVDGLDCWGLVKMIYLDLLRVELLDIGEEYPEDWSWKGKDLFMENYQKQWERVERPLPIDVVLLNNGTGVANHAGVMLNDRNFIHCIKAGVVVNRVTEKLWKTKVAGFFRYKRTT